jgi:4'-phosphopantetheinyl transferase
MNGVELYWPASPSRLSLPPDHVHLWCVPLELPPAAVEELLPLLSADERGRADRFRLEQLQRHFVAGRGRLRSILGRYLAAGPEQLEFQYGPRGKPALASPWDRSGIHFNMSHSQGLALVAVAGDRELGTDVEYVRPMRNLAHLVERYFSADENRQWRQLPPEEQLAGFFRAWTRKEAWLKAVGTGLAFPLEQVSVSLAADQAAGIDTIDGDPQEARQWSLDCSQPAAGYVAALAVRGRPPVVSRWSWR